MLQVISNEIEALFLQCGIRFSLIYTFLNQASFAMIEAQNGLIKWQ